MENFSKEGRKLRPRKNSDSEHRPAGEHRSYSNHKPTGEHKSYGENKPYGEHKPFGEHRSFGEHKSYGGHKPTGEHKSYGERRPAGEHRSYSSHKPTGEHKSYGENKPYSDRKPYGERKSFGEHRSFGNKPGFKRGRYSNQARFDSESDKGVNRMLENKPQINGKEFSSNVPQVEISEVMRLNKFIANSGVCSRREADTYIQAGVVTVNGEVVTELGTRINVINDDIRFNGERLRGEEKVYLILNKPTGYVTTASDPHADKTVMDLLNGCTSRVFPVGRLDKNTTGVLMFTNDGEISERLTHPAYEKKKIYQVILNRELAKEDYDKCLSGVELSDGVIAADELEYIDPKDHRKMGIEIHSGKNRVVRRIFEALGYDVRALDRVYFAGLTKKGLKRGEWRYLTEGEVNILKMGAYV